MLKIPTIMTADELIDKAFRKASKVTVSAPSKRIMIRQKSVAKIDSISNTLTTVMEKYVRAFPSMDNLPPFYGDIIDHIVGLDDLKKSLGAIHWCAGQIKRISRPYRTRIGRSRDPEEIDGLREEAYGRIASLVRQVDPNLGFLREARDQMKLLPTINPEMKTIVVAGAPNVGKSQLVRSLSTGKPRVASYPFTTKEITVGLLVIGREKFQVIDTPGLLDRPLEERNDIELNSIIALKHLANLIIFVLDPTGSCGYPIEYQLSLLEEIRRLYPDANMLVVENKADLINMTDSGRLRVSALKRDGIDELLGAIERELSDSGVA